MKIQENAESTAETTNSGYDAEEVLGSEVGEALKEAEEQVSPYELVKMRMTLPMEGFDQEPCELENRDVYLVSRQLEMAEQEMVEINATIVARKRVTEDPKKQDIRRKYTRCLMVKCCALRCSMIHLYEEDMDMHIYC